MSELTTAERIKDAKMALKIAKIADRARIQAHRLIEKGALSENPVREDFENFLFEETGGFVALGDGAIEEYSDIRYWRVPTVASDGHSALPFNVVRYVDEDGLDLKERIEFESVGPIP